MYNTSDPFEKKIAEEYLKIQADEQRSRNQMNLCERLNLSEPRLNPKDAFKALIVAALQAGKNIKKLVG